MWSLLYTMVNETGLSIPPSFFSYIWYIIRAILLAKILLHDVKKTNRVIWSLVILLLGLVSSYCSKSDFLEPFFWFLASGYQVNVRDIIKTLFKAQLIAIAITIICSGVGVIESNDIIREETGVLRRSLGFSHPNALAQKIFQLCMMYIYLVADRISLIHIVMILIVNCLNYQLTNSNTMLSVTFIVIFFLLLYIFERKEILIISRMSNFTLRLLKYICYLAGGISIYFALNPNNSFALKMDQGNTLLSRVTQISIYFQTYKITLFGQQLYYHNSDTAIGKYVGLYTLDNAYIYLLLGFGIVVFVFLIGLFIKALYKSVKEREYIVLILIAAYMIYGVTETALIRFSYNFTLVLLFAVVWKQNFNRITRDR